MPRRPRRPHRLHAPPPRRIVLPWPLPAVLVWAAAWLMFAGLVCGILGFTGGLWMGTDNYTISTACNGGPTP